MERSFDFGAVLVKLGLTKASLEIIHAMHSETGLDTVDKLMAGSNITQQTLYDAIEDIEEIMTELKPLEG